MLQIKKLELMWPWSITFRRWRWPRSAQKSENKNGGRGDKENVSRNSSFKDESRAKG